MTPEARVAMTLEQCWHRVPGGTAVAGIEMSRAVAATGAFSVTGVAAAHRRSPGRPWDPPVEVKHLPLPRRLLYESWMRLRRPGVERATGPVDVVHATTIAMPPAAAPVAVTIHDLAFLAEPGHFTRNGLRFFRRNLDIALDEADLVLCSSRTVRTEALEAGFDDARLRQVPFGVTHTPITAELAALVAAGYGIRGPFVLWSGTIEPRKNLRTLLAAFAQLPPPIELVLAGPRGWNEDLERLIEPVKDRVIAPGFLARPDLEALYRAASVFCFPSLREGFGFPVLEAMAHGTPVVTSRGTSTEEVAGEAALLVDPLDADALAGALSSALDDEAVARRLREAGPARAREFTWDKTAAVLTDVYRELMER